MVDNSRYYRYNAQQFFNATVDVAMEPLYQRFLAHVKPGGCLLDAGCGSGRDAKHFARLGYQVTAFDASPELAALAAINCGLEITVRTFSEINETSIYDGIWCCASLLHVPAEQMADTLNRIWRALKPGGCFYASYKWGTGEREKARMSEFIRPKKAVFILKPIFLQTLTKQGSPKRAAHL